MKTIQRYFNMLTLLVLITSVSACSQQQVVGSAISVAKLPVKTAGSVAGATGRVVGGAVGGAVGGNLGRRVGRTLGDKAARAAVPKL